MQFLPVGFKQKEVSIGVECCEVDFDCLLLSLNYLFKCAFVVYIVHCYTVSHTAFNFFSAVLMQITIA